MANKGKEKYTIIIIQSRRKLTHPNIRTIIPCIRSNEKECGPVILKKIIIYKSLPRKILCLHLVYFSMHFVIGYNTIHHQEYYDSQWKNWNCLQFINWRWAMHSYSLSHFTFWNSRGFLFFSNYISYCPCIDTCSVPSNQCLSHLGLLEEGQYPWNHNHSNCKYMTL